MELKKGLYQPTAEDRAKFEGMEVAVLVPNADYECHAKFAKCLVNLVAYSWMHGLRIYQMGISERTVVHWARNELSRHFCETPNYYTGNKFTHALWLDNDHVFNPDMGVYLAKHGDLDLVSALYYARAEKHLPVVYVKDATDNEFSHHPLIEVPPALVEVDAVGFGACLMRADVLERFEYPWFKFDRSGEDIGFCVRAKQAGARVWCDGSYVLGHIGEPIIITTDSYLRYMQEHAEEYKDRVRVGLGGKVNG